jgi:hypothetical protein
MLTGIVRLRNRIRACKINLQMLHAALGAVAYGELVARDFVASRGFMLKVNRVVCDKCEPSCTAVFVDELFDVPVLRVSSLEPVQLPHCVPRRAPNVVERRMRIQAAL